ncbi:MAG: hypothetical protein R2747_09080 [Pyrinomonadaceae bacterium]
MNKKILKYALFGGFILLTLTTCKNESTDTSSERISLQTKLQNQDDLEEIRKLIERFRTSDYKESEAIQEEIVRLTFKSPELREAVIIELTHCFSVQNRRNPDEYRLWTGVALTLGKLRAEEAIEILANCIDCNNGLFSFHLETFPSAYALFEIGKPAIPKLIEVIKTEPVKGRPNRLLAVLVLFRIGGKDVKGFFKRQLKDEKDKQIARAIKLGLDKMRTESDPNGKIPSRLDFSQFIRNDSRCSQMIGRRVADCRIL